MVCPGGVCAGQAGWWSSLSGTGKPLSHLIAGDRAEATPIFARCYPHIEWLLKQGRQLGVSAKLAGKLSYLWRSCNGELSEQNDLFRLTYALETAKDMHWNYRLLSDREWSGRNAVALSAGVNGIYLSRANLDVAFDDSGRQINPLTARLTGNVAGVIKLFNRCGWLAGRA